MAPHLVGLNPLVDIALDPSVPGTLYGAETRGASRSVANGATWQLLDNGLPPTATGVAIVVDHGAPEHLLLMVRVGATGSQTKALYASRDHGATWIATNGAFGDSGLDQQIVFDPSDSTRAYSRSAGIIEQSFDGGSTWTVMPVLRIRGDRSAPTSDWSDLFEER